MRQRRRRTRAPDSSDGEQLRMKRKRVAAPLPSCPWCRSPRADARTRPSRRAPGPGSSWPCCGTSCTRAKGKKRREALERRFSLFVKARGAVLGWSALRKVKVKVDDGLGWTGTKRDG